jgi:dipeptidyl aminopeptidase/acylaminoacyl peptidase
VLSINSLRARPYGGTGIKITKVVLSSDAYKQVLIEYSSDGLKITGTMNIPRGLGPFPVVIMDHGYFKPAEYKTGDGTSRAADAFARGGYLTIAPDYRCYAGSQCASNPLYVGYAIDVLNLIAQVQTVPDADPTRIGIWGHSMGGGITLRVLAINDTIKVAALYGALSGDDEVHYCWLIGCRTPTPQAIPARDPFASQRLDEADPDFLQALPMSSPLGKLHDIFLKSSPSRNLSNLTAAFIIHHGEADDIVPIEWSVDLANALTALGKTAQLYTYPGETHVFAGWGWQLFMTRTLSFFDGYLKPRDSIITADKRVLRQERIAAEQSY